MSWGEIDPTTEAHSKSEHHMGEASSDAVEVEVRPEEVPLPASTLWVSSAGSEPEEIVTIYNMVDVETPKEAPEREKAQSVETYSIMEKTPLNKNSSIGEITERLSITKSRPKKIKQRQSHYLPLRIVIKNPCELHSSSQSSLRR